MTSAVPRIRTTCYTISGSVLTTTLERSDLQLLWGAVRLVAGRYQFGRKLRPLQLLANIPKQISTPLQRLRLWTFPGVTLISCTTSAFTDFSIWREGAVESSLVTPSAMLDMLDIVSI